MERIIRVILAILVLGAAALPLAGAAQAKTSPYTPEEFPVPDGANTSPIPVAISGDWLVYLDYEFGGFKSFSAYNLESGESLTEPLYVSSTRPAAASGDRIVIGGGYDPFLIEEYSLSTGERRTIVTRSNSISSLDLWEDKLVWQEYNSDLAQSSIRALDLSSGKEYTVVSGAAYVSTPRIHGDVVVWEQAQASGKQRDVYGYRFSTGEAFPIATHPWEEYQPTVYGDVVVWVDERAAASNDPYGRRNTDIYGYDLEKEKEFAISTSEGRQVAPSIWDKLVVWEDQRDSDGLSGTDIYAYDLEKQVEFAITRHIGNQNMPLVHDKTVIWQDWRDSPPVKYATAGMYGATLVAKATAQPLPVAGAPQAFDGLIEVVWPHSGQPGTATDMVNIGVYLFTPQGSKREVPCAFRPQLQLWVAENNRPARLVKEISSPSWNWSPLVWHFNDVDVRSARMADNRMYFFLKTADDSYDFRTNVWAHAADARTFFPQPVLVRSAQAEPPESVDAIIQIVWPHDNKPVTEATMVNISANLFVSGTDVSVPADWEPKVILYRSLNNGVGEAVAVGEKRLVTDGSLVYPAWDFNDVDVSAARDPLNKYYFRLEVEGVETHSTIWSHGSDARTYFPAADVPECRCYECGAAQ